jgi:hypothetical protein
MSAGWDEDEAHCVFNEVNTDGEGGVGLDEFEAWWKGKLLQDMVAKERLRCDLTVPALNNNMERMAVYMERLGYEDHMSFFLASAVPIPSSTGGKGGSRSNATGSQLPFLQVEGDVMIILDSVAAQTDAGDHRGACKQLYDLLISNTTLLDIDPSKLLPWNGINTAMQTSEVIRSSPPINVNYVIERTHRLWPIPLVYS